jgi:LysM repeat protein
MRPFYSLLITLSFPLFLSAQQDSVAYLSASDTLVTFVHPMGELMFTHTLEPGQTLFSLARTYGLTMPELYAYNPHVTASYKIGVQLQLPLPLRAIIRQVPPREMLPGLALVYYRVKKGDTVFGLCNRTFEVPTAWLFSLNPFLVNGLSPGQLLHIGWISTQPIPKEWREIKGGPYAQLNHPMKLEYFRRSANRSISEERGAATWPKDLDDNSGFFCLHRTAPIHSLVEVYNPLTRQTMYLKVSDRLPARVYDKTVLVVVSPLAAKALGARDDRFYVHLKHY